jgi:hypothetical protein
MPLSDIISAQFCSKPRASTGLLPQPGGSIKKSNYNQDVDDLFHPRLRYLLLISEQDA